MADSDVVQITEGLLKQLSARLRRLEALVGGKTPRKLTKGGYDGLILVKLDAGQSLTTTASDTATGEIWTGTPGSETDTNIPVTVYAGRMNASGATIAAGSFILAADVGGYLQFMAPYAGSGTGGNMHMVLCELPSALTRAQSSKSGCTVIARFGDGTLPAVSSTITLTNPETTTGGTYFWAAPSGNHVLAIGNGTDYWIIKTEPVLLDDPLTDFQVDGSVQKLQKKTQDAYVDIVETESGWTDIHTGTNCP